MNFRTCQYFLMVCEMGTINAAARRLCISQQSLSEHIRKLEHELGVQLLHRDTPLVLTEAGRCFQSASQEIVSALDRLNGQLSHIKGVSASTLVIGCLDYGTPDFLTPLIELFLRRVPDTFLQTREFSYQEEIPADIPILISTRKLEGPYKSEKLFSDRLALFVRDELLEEIYGAEADDRRERLLQGDIHAVQECPFVQYHNTPLQRLSESLFEQNDFVPRYLPVAGGVKATAQLCEDGMAVMISCLELERRKPSTVPYYFVQNSKDAVSTAYICYRTDQPLSIPARRFIEIARQFFRQQASGSKDS